jgi:hypothetical protein
MTNAKYSTDDLVALFRAHARKAIRFEEVLVHTEPHGIFGSRVGGLPYLEKGEPWPRTSAGRPLHFLLQLDFRDTQNEFSCPLPFGLLTYFYTPNRHPLRDPDRVIRTYSNPSEELCEPLDFEGWDPELDHWHELTSPVPMDDMADLEDLEFLTGEELQGNVHSNFNTPAYQSFYSELKHKSKTRLGGFPRWLNGYHLPLCPRCEQLMFQLLQIDQLDIHDLYLGAGACGYGHLLFCPDHPEEFAICVSPLS